jgi:hypothetical protein
MPERRSGFGLLDEPALTLRVRDFRPVRSQQNGHFPVTLRAEQPEHDGPDQLPSYASSTRTNGHASSKDREILSDACDGPGADVPFSARIHGFSCSGREIR